MSSDRTSAVVPSLVFGAYVVVTATVVFAVGHITTALGALVMAAALVGLGAAARARRRPSADPANVEDSVGDEDVFRWHEVRVAALACLPALALPAELSSPMASAAFYLLFAVPTYSVVVIERAMRLRNERRSALGPIPPPTPVAPAGWYPDPVDPRVVRWWDGWAWTPYWAQPEQAG